MTGKLKALGIGLLAVLAMGALSASAASAAEFHSESTHTILDGSALNTQVFITSIGEITCSSVAIEEGTISGSTVSSITVKPAHSNCAVVVGPSVLEGRVTTTGCTLLLTNQTTADNRHYKFHIKCPETVSGSGVRDEIYLEYFAIGKFRPCFTIPEQTPTSGGVYFTNTNNHITIDATAEGIEYTTAAGACGPPGASNNASYYGKVTVKGTDTAGKEIGISFS